MCDHDERYLLVQLTIGHQVFFPHLLPRALDLRKLFVSVEVCAAQSRKMLAAPEDAGGPESFQKFLRIANHMLRIVGDGP